MRPVTGTNRAVLLRFAVRAVLAGSIAVLAAGLEPARLLRVLFACFFATALVCIVMGLRLREKLLQRDQLTHWDEAMAFFLLSHAVRQLA